jgi:hypothetical protein
LKNLKPSLDGLLWGTGCALAFCIVFTTYLLNFSAQLSYNHVKKLNTLVNLEFISLSELIDIDVISSGVKDNHVYIHSRYTSENDITALANSFKLVFSLFSDKGEFMGNCEAPLEATFTDEKHIYMETNCTPFIMSAKHFKTAQLTLVKSETNI